MTRLVVVNVGRAMPVSTRLACMETEEMTRRDMVIWGFCIIGEFRRSVVNKANEVKSGKVDANEFEFEPGTVIGYGTCMWQTWLPLVVGV